MDMAYAKISVGIVTYKQERLVGRMLDSILNQREYGLKEIFVCDDCSPDRNWDVILEYQRRFPDIIKPHRNKQNLGIYPNVDVMYNFLHNSNADIVIIGSGDDVFCDGFFQGVQDCILKNQVDCQKEKVAFFGDFKYLFPNGKEKVDSRAFLRNDSSLHLLDYYLNGEICGRSSALTKSCFDMIGSFPLDRGVEVAESLCEIQPYFHIERYFYLPLVCSIYYAGIGVSTTMNTAKSMRGRIEAYKDILQLYKDTLGDKARYILLSEIYRMSFCTTGKWIFFVKKWKYQWKSGNKFLTKKNLRQLGSMLLSKKYRINDK